MSPAANERVALLALNFFRYWDGQFPDWTESHLQALMQDLKDACAETGQDVVSVLNVIGAGLAHANPAMAHRLQQLSTADHRASLRAALFN
jgi:hypothetical protein